MAKKSTAADCVFFSLHRHLVGGRQSRTLTSPRMASGYLPEWASGCRLLQGATVSSRVGHRRSRRFHLASVGRRDVMAASSRAVLNLDADQRGWFATLLARSGQFSPAARRQWFVKIHRPRRNILLFPENSALRGNAAFSAATCLLSGSDGLRIPALISFLKSHRPMSSGARLWRFSLVDRSADAATE